MGREFFCCGCGLFFWRTQYEGCPNEECVTRKDQDIPVFAVDTLSYFYFSQNNKNFIDEIKWSSLKHAPKKAVEFYKKQGILIKD